MSEDIPSDIPSSDPQNQQQNDQLQDTQQQDTPQRQPIVLCAKTTKSLQKRASALQHTSTCRLLFRPLLPGISVAPAPWPPIPDNPDTPISLDPLEIPEDILYTQEEQLCRNAVLLLQRMTPRRLTSEHPVSTGFGCHARCSLIQASVPHCYRVTCEDGMAVARLLLPIWAAALCSLVGCAPHELVVVPLHEHTVLVSACSNPAGMATMAAAVLAAVEDDMSGVLLPEGVVIKEVPTPASQRWMQWASYAGNGSDIGFLTMDNVTQFPFPTNHEDLGDLQMMLRDKKGGIPLVRVNQYNTLRQRGGGVGGEGGGATDTQEQSWAQRLWGDKRLLGAVLGACLMVVSRILAYWLIPTQGVASA